MTDLTTWTPTTDVNLAELQHFTISGPETAEIAVEYREGVKLLIAEIEAVYRPHIKRAHAAHKALTTDLAERLAPCKAALDTLTQALGAYELQRRVQERQQREQAEAQAATTGSVLAVPAGVAPPVAGVAVTERWTAVVVDFHKLVQFAASHATAAHSAMAALCVQPNEKGLQELVDRSGDAFAIPGVIRVPAAPVVRSSPKR